MGALSTSSEELAITGWTAASSRDGKNTDALTKDLQDSGVAKSKAQEFVSYYEKENAERLSRRKNNSLRYAAMWLFLAVMLGLVASATGKGGEFLLPIPCLGAAAYMIYRAFSTGTKP